MRMHCSQVALLDRQRLSSRVHALRRFAFSERLSHRFFGITSVAEHAGFLAY
jgi:hypothetical protein